MKKPVRTALAIAGTLAVVGYAIWAQESTPYRFPADRLIDLQAAWDHGRYGLKFTVMASTLVLIAIIGLAVVPVMALVRLVTLGRRDPTAATALPELQPGWTVLQRWPSAISPIGALLGLGLGFVYLRALVFAPETVEPLGGPGGVLGVFVLIVGPLVAIIGEFFAAETILGPGLRVGTIDQLTTEQQGRNTMRYVWIGQDRFSVRAAVYARLRVGQPCAVHFAGGTRRVLELRAQD